MPGTFNKTKKMLKYKPKTSEPFELLESGSEGEDRKNTQEGTRKSEDNSSGNKSVERRSRERNIALTINEWIKNKKEDIMVVNQEDKDNISSDLNMNLELIKQKFNYPKNQDIALRHFRIGKETKAVLVFILGMIDKKIINRDILEPLMTCEISAKHGKNYPIEYLMENVLTTNNLSKEKKIDKVVMQVLNGGTALLIDGYSDCILIETKGYEKRSVDKPLTENVVLGSQEGFTENLRTNITLVRRIIKNSNLITETLPIGKTNNINCALLYINGIANAQVLKEVKRRIQSINTDFITGSGMLTQFIEDNPLMLFPQTLSTERPDRTASFLMEGKVAIITEGAPFAEVVPVTFFHFFHTSEDSSLRWQYGTFLRMIRVLGVFVTTMLPALYIAVTLFHQEMIPTELLASIASAKEQVPFPTPIEIILLEISFELIREGGIRVPGVIGQTLGIVGALILGQAAVAAGLVSPILIIIVSVTGLGSFAIPNYSLALGLRILRFFFIFLASVLGFYGISLGIFIMGCTACSMKSFGVPFLSPVAPRVKINPDVIIRQPVWKQENRPDYSNVPNVKRQSHISRGWKNKDKGDSDE